MKNCNPINISALKKRIKGNRFFISRETIDECDYFIVCDGIFALAFPVNGVTVFFNDLKHLLCGKDGNQLKNGEQVTYENLNTAPTETVDANMSKYFENGVEPVEITEFSAEMTVQAKKVNVRVCVADGKSITVQQSILDIVPDAQFLTKSPVEIYNALFCKSDTIKFLVLPVRSKDAFQQKRIDAIAALKREG